MHGTSAKTGNKTNFRTVSSLEITLHEKITEKNTKFCRTKKIPVSTYQYSVKTHHLTDETLSNHAIQLQHIGFSVHEYPETHT